MTKTTTDVQATAPTDGWHYVLRTITEMPSEIVTTYRRGWDGTYTAACPCGADATWNAWTTQVQYCTCDG